MAHWLQQAGKIRAGRKPEPDILAELFRSSAGQFTCPECGHIGLMVALDEEDNGDWPGPRPCSDCGRPIPAERLEAVPGTTLCSACQQRDESGGPPAQVEYCPKCGAPMELRLTRTPGISRYVMACTASPPCRR
jgi:hypothetical protein